MVLVSCIQYSSLLTVSCMYKVQTFSHQTNRSMFCIFSQLHRKSLNRAIYRYPTFRINPFQPTGTFHIETSHLIWSVNQVTCFNMKCNTWLRWVQIFSWIMFRTLYQKRCWNIAKHFEQGKTRQLHDVNSQRKVNATCKNFVSLQVFVWKYVNSFNVKFCNEFMNFILLFFSVIDELQSNSN